VQVTVFVAGVARPNRSAQLKVESVLIARKAWLNGRTFVSNAVNQ
jgi:hypothetical protein